MLLFINGFPLLGCACLWREACLFRREVLSADRRMGTMSEDQSIEMRSTAPGWTLPAIVLLGLVAAAGLVFGWKATSQLDSTKADVAAQVAKMRQGVDQDLSAMKGQVADTKRAPKKLTLSIRRSKANWLPRPAPTT